MTRPIEFSRAAREEFDEAFDWYARRSPAAAIGFAEAMDVALERVESHPDLFARTYANCRQCRLGRYPYCVVYQQEESRLVVVAVAHASRRPGYWRKRV